MIKISSLDICHKNHIFQPIYANTRSGLITLHSLLPERFFKVQKGLPLNGGNSVMLPSNSPPF